MSRRKRKRLEPTLGDYLAIAVGPLLIGLLVGSMVFFLIEVFYQGQFGGRLQFIMAWFVVGAVGIARISISDGREYAAVFAAPLAILVAIAAWRYVEFQGPLQALSPVLSIGLVALIWWSTDCLTWDCTVLDDEDEDVDGGAGLLETAGLVSVDAAAEQKPDADAVTTHEPTRKTLWERFVEYRRRPHAPGVWVLYFSLAALPLFGLGQVALANRDDARQRFVFLLLVVYVASGLGLLLITSFLNLRRYLRQRRLTMPVTMAATWVASGTFVIAAILFVCLLLAGSGVGYTVGDLPVFAAARESRATSKWARRGEGVEKEDGERQVARDDASRVREGDDGSPEGERGNADDPGGQPDDNQTAARDTRPKNDRQPAEDQADRPRPRATQQAAGDQASGDRDLGDQAAQEQQQQGQEGEVQPQRDAEAEQQAQREQPGESPPQTPPNIPNVSVATDWLKVLGWAVLALVVGTALWWYRAAVWGALAGLLERLRDMWANLFPAGMARPAAEAGGKAEVTMRRKTFAEFSDPFASGAVEGASTNDLIRYSFEAFEAWSGDLGLRRRPQQTAHEFVEVVGDRHPAIAREAHELAELVSWSAFAHEPVPRGRVRHLEKLWKRMRREPRTAAVMSDL